MRGSPKWLKGVLIASLLALAGAAPGMTVKEIMDRLNKGPHALTTVLKRELQSADPHWNEIQQQTDEYAQLVSALTQTPPPKGSTESWIKLTKQTLTDAQALQAAAHQKDKQAALAAHSKLTHACMGCHRAHRP